MSMDYSRAAEWIVAENSFHIQYIITLCFPSLKESVFLRRRRKTVIKFRQWVLDYLCTENEEQLTPLAVYQYFSATYANQREHFFIFLSAGELGAVEI